MTDDKLKQVWSEVERLKERVAFWQQHSLDFYGQRDEARAERLRAERMGNRYRDERDEALRDQQQAINNRYYCQEKLHSLYQEYKNVQVERDEARAIVAAMMARRCDGCRHWTRHNPEEGFHRGGCGDLFIITDPDFYCNEWEAKPLPENDRP